MWYIVNNEGIYIIYSSIHKQYTLQTKLSAQPLDDLNDILTMKDVQCTVH